MSENIQCVNQIGDASCQCLRCQSNDRLPVKTTPFLEFKERFAKMDLFLEVIEKEKFSNLSDISKRYLLHIADGWRVFVTESTQTNRTTFLFKDQNRYTQYDVDTNVLESARRSWLNYILDLMVSELEEMSNINFLGSEDDLNRVILKLRNPLKLKYFETLNISYKQEGRVGDILSVKLSDYLRAPIRHKFDSLAQVLHEDL